MIEIRVSTQEEQDAILTAMREGLGRLLAEQGFRLEIVLVKGGGAGGSVTVEGGGGGAGGAGVYGETRVVTYPGSVTGGGAGSTAKLHP